MLSSELDERVTFLKKEVTGRDEFNGEIKEYVPYKTLMANVSYKTSTEKEINNQLTALRVIKLKIRHRRDLDETMRVEFWGDVFNIRYIEHYKREVTFITAERGKD